MAFGDNSLGINVREREREREEDEKSFICNQYLHGLTLTSVQFLEGNQPETGWAS